MVNKLNKALFLGGVAFGGVARIPLKTSISSEGICQIPAAFPSPNPDFHEDSRDQIRK